MFAFSSVPFFFLNIIFVLIASNKLSIGRSFSNYKPRFDFFFCLIWSYIPLSFMSAFTDSFGLHFINNYNYCSAFSIADNFAWLSFFTCPILVIYLFLLIFTKIKLSLVNKIGNVFSFLLPIAVLIRGYLFTYFIGSTRYHLLENGYFSECSFAEERMFVVSLSLAYISQATILLFVLFIFFYDRFHKMTISKKKKLKLKKKNEGSNSKIDGDDDEVYKFYNKLKKVNMIKSFSWIAISTVVIDVGERLIKLSGLFPFWFYSIAVDLKRFKPFIYSLIIIIYDKPASIEISDYPVKRILEIPELTKILEKFIRERGEKRLKDTYEKIKLVCSKLIEKTVEESSSAKDGALLNDDLGSVSDKEKNLVLLEKEILNIGLYDFYLSDEFIFFLFKFQKTGMLEMEIGDQRR